MSSSRLVVLDMDSYRQRLTQVVRRLQDIPNQANGYDRVVVGRVSGVYLALAHLEEFVREEVEG